MKDVEKMVGKFFCINGKYYARYFPGTTERRFREDDHEWVYWREYKRVGGGQTENNKREKFSILRVDSVTDNSYRFAQSSMFKTIKKHEWFRGLIITVFSENYIGLEGDFWELFDKI